MKCKQCGLCCIWIQVGTTIPDSPNIDWDFVKARDLIAVDHGNVLVFFAQARCKHLTKDNKCDIHDNKPQSCIRFPENPLAAPPSCYIWGGEDEDSNGADIQRGSPTTPLPEERE
ncbi:MAG: hypothetical protein GTN80_03695 [Nitrososphaeria archaeon]|nr:hypothetical protein [Nitrososphaeria archaeon]NIQ32735.1 hypothetical protein [Nitrososphaeria archaeon]